MSTVTISREKLLELCKPACFEHGRKIAQVARARRGISRYKGKVYTVETEQGARVIDNHDFAVVDEYGSPTHPATGAMRSAALDSGGTYTINPKP